MLDRDRARAFVDRAWDDHIVPALVDYIRIPNKSPMFDPDWRAHGHMDRAVDLVAGWCREHGPADMTLEVVRLGDRTPVIWMDVPATGGSGDTVLLYGHLDKQPEMTGWAEGLGPWTPVVRGDRLYGRGGADDGYAAFASIAAINALRDQNAPHPRCVVLIEACEESGSYDLPAYIDHLASRIGTPSLVVCLDSGCGNYDQLWCTTSLRGIATMDVTVSLLKEGVHSGDASGIVPSSFRVLRALLSRLEDEATGRIVPPELHADIPAQRRAQAAQVAEVLGTAVYDKFPWQDGARPVTGDLAELVLARTWRPALAITGAAGLPPLDDAGNVMRPFTSLKLSLRLPPTTDAQAALDRVRALLTADPPYGARVEVTRAEAASGWDAPPVAPWLERALDEASRAYFGAGCVYMGEGGSIPFMGMLGARFPDAQFLITGVLGPHSNAHGPNEFLHIPTGKKLTGCVAHVLATRG
ncbi:MAG: M20/M25/M40 family metallo-hydrolase [Deltaproteobacteria bacterium]|nr:MAG: M20/M25/M40 family metallo-hydrolase [Deltaproteobacteria bacterium]